MGWFTSVRSTITCTPCSPAQAPSCGNSPPGIMWRVFPGGGQRSGLRRFIRQQCLCPERRHRRHAVAIHHRGVRGLFPGSVERAGLGAGVQGIDIGVKRTDVGAKVWQFTTGNSIDTSPAVANGVVYVSSGDNNVYALNASTGAELWQFTTGSFVESSPVVANGVVYVGSDDNNIYAFKMTNPAEAPARPDPATLRPNLGLGK